ncbi:MAG TPA: SufD family Fe-S cluster assembly protein [Candidatus Nanoarchaeia archaeon]|nr:SufD family Fe-S cluster assembly protein [Candidatus Nanoarchaeia archaeon]
MNASAKVVLDKEVPTKVVLANIVPTKVASAKVIPVKVMHITSGETVLQQQPEHSLLVRQGVKATILSTAMPEQKFHILIEEGAEVVVCTIHQHSTCKSSSDVHKDARIQWIDILLDDSNLQLQTNLLESGAEVSAYQAFLGSADIQSDVLHASGHTKSTMIAKGILQNGLGTYRGTITIPQQSSGCIAHQRSDMILLDDQSRGDAVPILDVSNDDVQCSHGATLGQIDESKIFYLASRGFTEDQAKKMIVEGFLASIIEHVPNESVKQEIQQHLERGLTGGKEMRIVTNGG